MNCVEHFWVIRNSKTGKFLMIERYWDNVWRVDRVEGCWVWMDEADRYLSPIHVCFGEHIDWGEGEEPELEDLEWKRLNITYEVE
jgi:hypothetical protein